MANPRDESFSRGAAAALVRPGCGYCRWLVEIWNCVHVDISLGHAHRKRARYGNAQAIIRRGEPVQLQWWGFWVCNRAEEPVWRAMGGYENCAMLE